MESALLVVVIATIKKIVDVIKYAAAQDMNGLVTQLVSWLAGIAVVFIGAKSDWGDNILIGNQALDTLSNWSLVLIGIALASTAGLTWDLIKAFDNSHSATVPTLLAPHDRHDATPI